MGPTPSYTPVAGTVQDPSSWIGAHPKKAQKGLFTLAPGRYPDTVGLPEVLAQAAKAQQADAIGKIASTFQDLTGIAPDPELMAAAIANPAAIADLLTASPAELHQGIDALNLADDQGKVPKLAPKKHRLPNHFDLSKAGAIVIDLPKPELKELAPGLFQGDLPTKASEASVRSNLIMAEVFDRLAENAGKPKQDRFVVELAGHKLTKLSSFLDALAKDGYAISATVEHRIANFTNLKTKAQNGQVLDVPAALMVKTGVVDELGREAVVPATHSELVFHIQSGPTSKGPALEANIKFYQGVSGTGFFACDTAATPAWCGRSVGDEFTGKQALRAAELSGLLSEVINKVAKDLDLAVGGYGATGVCNDSVAIVQHALTGRTTAFPLLMRDELFTKELTTHLSDKDQSDDPEYSALSKSITLAPTDRAANDSLRARALASLPWAKGQEPFKSSELARQILEAD